MITRAAGGIWPRVAFDFLHSEKYTGMLRKQSPAGIHRVLDSAVRIGFYVLTAGLCGHRRLHPKDCFLSTSSTKSTISAACT